jgi:hypothetical protein
MVTDKSLNMNLSKNFDKAMGISTYSDIDTGMHADMNMDTNRTCMMDMNLAMDMDMDIPIVEVRYFFYPETQ